MKTLVLGLGNELLGDDGAGIHAVRALARETIREVFCMESNLTCVALLDLFLGYRKAIIADTVFSNGFEPGTILELDAGEFRAVPNPSPHYTGLPEMMGIARRLKLEFPEEIRIIAMAGSDNATIGMGLSAPVKLGMGRWVERIKNLLLVWNDSLLNLNQGSIMEKTEAVRSSKKNRKKSSKNLEELIRQRAYEIYLIKGEDGEGGISHWLQAEKELKS